MTVALASRALEMDYNGTDIGLVHLHAIEETLRYVEEHGSNTTYEGLLKHLSWYWQDHNTRREHKPQGWVLEWIKCLAGVAV